MECLKIEHLHRRKTHMAGGLYIQKVDLPKRKLSLPRRFLRLWRFMRASAVARSPGSTASSSPVPSTNPLSARSWNHLSTFACEVSCKIRRKNVRLVLKNCGWGTINFYATQMKEGQKFEQNQPKQNFLLRTVLFWQLKFRQTVKSHKVCSFRST